MPSSRRFVLAGALAALTSLAAQTTAATAQQAPIANVAGNYLAWGMNADGSNYAGQVQIIQQGNAVEVYWSVASQSYSGRGWVEGRVVTVNWGSSSPVVYVLMGRELHGTWNNGTALEKLTPR